MRGFGNAILLERPVDGVPGQQRFGAQRLVGLLAEAAGEAATVDPLHARVVATIQLDQPFSRFQAG